MPENIDKKFDLTPESQQVPQSELEAQGRESEAQPIAQPAEGKKIELAPEFPQVLHSGSDEKVADVPTLEQAQEDNAQREKNLLEMLNRPANELMGDLYETQEAANDASQQSAPLK